MARTILEKYIIKEGETDISVHITGGQGITKRYELEKKIMLDATKALIDEIKKDLILHVNISPEEVLNPKILFEIKKRFADKAEELLKQKLPDAKPETSSFLIATLMREMLGLGDIDILLTDPQLEEIVIMSSEEPVRIYHRKYGWLITNIKIEDEQKIIDFASTIARRVGRQISNLNPLLDAHLTTGDRANALLFPISTKGNTITIRKFARDPWTVIDFINNGTGNAELFALIWLAIQYESNVLISGGTGSGKTSLMNSCMMFIPPNHRIISIEDTREITLPPHLYWAPLTTRQPNPEGKGEVNMIDLLINSLRMRPDRIILGEMRKKEQAEVLFEAMHTGHSVYATVHADSISGTIQRLTNPPISVPPNLLQSVNLNVVMFRDRRKNIRRVYQIGEYIATEEMGISNIKPNIIFRWNQINDKVVTHNKPLRLFEELTRNTGLNYSEIQKDINDKKSILEWMTKNNIRDIKSVGKIFDQYYLDPINLLTMIKNKKPEEVLRAGLEL